jgi:hypothetical protein
MRPWEGVRRFGPDSHPQAVTSRLGEGACPPGQNLYCSTAMGSCRLRPGVHPRKTASERNRESNSRTPDTEHNAVSLCLEADPGSPGLGLLGDTAQTLWSALVERGGYSTIHRFGQVWVAELVEGGCSAWTPAAGWRGLPNRSACLAARRLVCDHSTWPSLRRSR